MRAGIPERTLDYLDIQRCNFTRKTLTWMLLLLIGRQETGLPTLQPEVRFALPPQKLQPTIFKLRKNSIIRKAGNPEHAKESAAARQPVDFERCIFVCVITEMCLKGEEVILDTL